MRRVLIIGTLFLTVTSIASAQATVVVPDTMPAAVVQRFVDAANSRDARAIAALVAPDASFERFPGGGVLVQGRDSIQTYYARILATLSADFRITVQPRTVEGQLVIDQEHYTGMPPSQNQTTWMYLVRRGLIQRAWLLEGASPRAQ
ncbi:MAG: SgcJ/EcaC family oxidoreductase [Gemmatimonadota bacterium]